MCKEDIEIIDLDADEYTSEGINKETGEYNPNKDAWYPSFKELADAEKEILDKKTFLGEKQ